MKPASTRSRKLLEFETAFYEQLLKEHPDFVDVLRALGEAYTRQGWHEKGLAVDQRLSELRPNDPVAWYNLACSLSLLSRTDEALEALRRAMAVGYDDFECLSRDPDLAMLRRSPKFRQFLETLAPSKRS